MNIKFAIILWTVCPLWLSPAIMAQVLKAQSEASGLLLEAFIDAPGNQWNEVKATCRLTNKSDSSVPFGSYSRAQGLILTIYDRDDKIVKLKPQEVNLFERKDGVYFRYVITILHPGDSIEFVCKLLDIFDASDLSGCTLKVRWDRGYGGTGARFPSIPNLEVTVMLPSGLPVKALSETLPQAEPNNLTSVSITANVSSQTLPETVALQSGVAQTITYSDKWKFLWLWGIAGILLVIVAMIVAKVTGR